MNTHFDLIDNSDTLPSAVVSRSSTTINADIMVADTTCSACSAALLLLRNPRLFIVLLTTQSCMKQLVLHTDVLAASIAASHC